MSSRANEWASERMSAAERASKASSVEQASKWAVKENERANGQANERADERMAQYLRPDFRLILTIEACIEDASFPTEKKTTKLIAIVLLKVESIILLMNLWKR